MKNERVYITNWLFSIQGKEFSCSFFDDNSCDFYPWDERNKQSSTDRNIFLKAILGDSDSKKNVLNHEREYTVTAENLDPQLIIDVSNLKKKLDLEEDLTKEEEMDIMVRLEPYFWDQINPYLPRPLSK